MTTAIRPSDRVRDVRIDKAVSTFSRSEIFFEPGLDKPNQLERFCEFAVFAQPIKMATAADQPSSAPSLLPSQHSGYDRTSFELDSLAIDPERSFQLRRPPLADNAHQDALLSACSTNSHRRIPPEYCQCVGAEESSRTRPSQSVGVASRFEISQLCPSRTSRKP